MAGITGNVEKVTLLVESPKAPLAGLDAAIARYQVLEQQVLRVNKALAGISGPMVMKRTAQEIKKELEGVAKAGGLGSYKPEAVAKALGLDVGQVKQFVRQANAELKHLMKGGEFRSLEAAAKGMARFTKVQYGLQAEARQAARNLTMVPPAPVATATAAAAPVQATVNVAGIEAAIAKGLAPLQAIAAQLGAAVKAGGVAVGGGAGSGAAGGKGNQSLPAAAGSAPTRGRNAGGGFVAAYPMPVASDEVGRVVRRTQRSATVAVTQALAPLETLTTVYDESGNPLSEVQRKGNTLKKRIREQIRLLDRSMRAEISTGFTGDRAQDYITQAGIYRKGANKLSGIATIHRKPLMSIHQGDVADELESRAALLLAKAKEAEAKAWQARVKQREQAAKDQERYDRAGRAQAEKELKEQVRNSREVMRVRRGAAKADEVARNLAGAGLTAQQAEQLKQALEAQGYGRRTSYTRSNTRAGQTREMTEDFTKKEAGLQKGFRFTTQYDAQGMVVATKIRETTKSLRKEIEDAEKKARAASRNFLDNTRHVTLWAASVGTLYGTIGLVTSSLSKMTETGLQTQRLDQVFRKVGGTTIELRDATLATAAAYGGVRKEAMDSAIAWSRFGLSMREVGEAVRVSLQGANVAEITTQEATANLSALMVTYGLRVKDLAGVMGMLNSVSNNFGVTNQDLFTGLSRTAAVAQQAGISLEELIGLLGATVGATKQSGANIGNALKSITVAFGNPEIQRYLRDAAKIEVTARGGDEMKEMSQIISEVYLAYQRLNEAERQNLTYKVAGKTQASRFAAVLDNYVKAQVLAINSQLDLNSAEEENKKIMASLHAQLKGVVAEWERFVVIQGDRGPMAMLQGVTQSMRALLSLSNTKGGSWLVTLLGAISVAAVARLALAATNLALVGKTGGFVAASVMKVRDAMAGLSAVTTTAALAFARHAQSMGGAMPMIGKTAAWLDLFGLKMQALSRDSAKFGVGMRVALGTVGAFSRTLGLAISMVGQYAGQLALLYAGYKLVTMAAEQFGLTSEQSNRRLAGYNAEVEKARANSQAASQGARLMQVGQRSLANPNLDPGERRKWVDNLNDLKLLSEETRKQLEMAIEQGNVAEQNRLLEAERLRLIGESATEYNRAYLALRNQRGELERELDRLKNSPLASDTSIKEKEAELARVKEEMLNNRIGSSRVDEEALAHRLESEAENVKRLEEQKQLLQSIAEIYGSLPARGVGDRAMIERESLRAQQKADENLLKRLELDDQAKMEGERRRSEERKKWMEEEIRLREEAAKRLEMVRPGYRTTSEAEEDREYRRLLGEAEQARQMAAQSPNVLGPREQDNVKMAEETRRRMREREAQIAALDMAMANRRRQDRLGFAAELQGARNASFGVGAWEAERLLSKRKGLMKEADVQEAIAKSSGAEQVDRENAIVALRQVMVDLRETDLEIQKKILDLGREEKSLMIEKRREFEKALLMAGPGRMLEMMAVAQLGRRGLGVSQWMSMDPRMRETMGMVYPQYDPTVRDLRLQRLMLGKPRSEREMQAEAEGMVARGNRYALPTGGMVPEPKDFFPHQEAVMAAQALTSVGTAAQGAAQALQMIPQVVAGLAAKGGGGTVGTGQAGGRYPGQRG